MTSKYPELLSTNGQPLKLGPIPVVAKHRLHELDLFSDSALIDLLNSHPRDQLQAFTMGTDCENRQEWQPVDTAGATGSDLSPGRTQLRTKSAGAFAIFTRSTDVEIALRSM